MSNIAKNFDILAISLNTLHNYFNSSNYFFYLYPAKILDFSAKLFFPCIYYFEKLISEKSLIKKRTHMKQKIIYTISIRFR